MSSFQPATTKEAVDEITSSAESILPIESNIRSYYRFLGEIFNPSNIEANNPLEQLWEGVNMPTFGDYGQVYGGDTPEQYVPKIEQNFINMERGSDEQKLVAKKVLDALMVLPSVVEKANLLLPQISQAKSEAESHMDKSWLGSTKQRRRKRYQELDNLEYYLNRIKDYSENGKNKMIIEAITSREKEKEKKREQMVAFSAIQKGTKDPITGEINENPLNPDVIKQIQKYLGGKGYSKCKKIKGKKYITRKSPAYSASKCAKGTKKKGNDGKMYIVKASKNGVKRWVKYTQKKKSKSKKKNKH
jgi:hypothetical protein